MIELRNNYWAVEVPEGAENFEILPSSDADLQALSYEYSKPCGERYDQGMMSITDLSPGTWEIVCTSKEASVAHAAKIVEDIEVGYKGYNYRKDNVLFWREPIDSFYSLLTSKGCDLNKTYLILKKQ